MLNLCNALLDVAEAVTYGPPPATTGRPRDDAAAERSPERVAEAAASSADQPAQKRALSLRRWLQDWRATQDNARVLGLRAR